MYHIKTWVLNHWTTFLLSLTFKLGLKPVCIVTLLLKSRPIFGFELSSKPNVRPYSGFKPKYCEHWFKTGFWGLV